MTDTTPTDAELDARVSKGAALFDERYPRWAALINRDALDLSDTRYCAAAQIVTGSQDDDSYVYAMDELFGGCRSADEPFDHGFSLSCWEVRAYAKELGLAPDVQAQNRDKIYAPLTAAWQRAIDARLNKD